uniref:Uncharacterized protein n=1 Tax=Anguilla anguilla TaxID=7936 RepID=A0A0E9QGV8_ANGAN
MQGPRLKLG